MGLMAGSAAVTINPQIGDDLSGQYHRRFAEYIRDDLEANAFYLTDGSVQVLLINLDLAGLLEASYLREVRAIIQDASGVPAEDIIISSTHTHAGPDTMGLLNDSPVNLAYMERLKHWLPEVACKAVESAKEARVGWGLGDAEVGYNRRLCWADGSHTMYGDTSRPDFTGIEGPNDSSHSVLFAIDQQDNMIAVLHGNCCHATCMEGENYVSADFPGEARRLLRQTYGQDLPVLYLQGASGDVAHWDLVHQTHRDGQRRCREIGAALAAETMRLIYTAETTDTPVLRHNSQDLRLGIRLPNCEELEKARKTVELGEEEAGRYDYINAISGVIRLHDAFKDDPTDTLEIHALRVGDWAMITNPCELYCSFGHDIKRRSPAEVTAMAQLSNGYSGYCPTIPALLGGGYSAFAIYWCRLEDYAGYKIVEASADQLHQLWQ